MESQSNRKVFIHSSNKKIEEESPLEASTNLTKPLDVDWRYLMAKIYQNINGPPVLKKKKSSKLIMEEDSSISSDTTTFRCNCKKTKCLKLYCECFAKGKYRLKQVNTAMAVIAKAATTLRSTTE